MKRTITAMESFGLFLTDKAAAEGVDACVSLDGDVVVSQHRYSYSMGFGDAWRLQRPIPNDAKGWLEWGGGTAYNYGMLPPLYPMPAIV